MIRTYFDQLKRVIDDYAIAPFVLDAQVSFELRPGDQGYVSGAVLFRDQSALYFREYLDGMAEQVSKLMYSYHYQNADGYLIFRYDNARHRPALSVQDHKHTPDQIVTGPAPMLANVLVEIVVVRGWI